MRGTALIALSALAACGTPAPAPVTPAARAGATAESPAAFVIVTGRRTIVVPVDPSRALVEASGRWLLDETGEQPRVVWNGDDAWDLPECGCACEACVQTRTVDPETGRLSAPDDRCRCSVGERSEACPPPADEPSMDGDGCGTGEGATEAALTFGVLTTVSFWQEGCEGINSYDGTSNEAPLVERPAAPEPPEDAATTCAWDGVTHDELARVVQLERPSCRLDGGEWSEVGEPGECYGCEHADEQRVQRVRRGRIWELRAGIGGSGGGPLVQRVWPASPEDCGPMDPCGDPRAFPDIEAAAEFWVANDASAALALEDGVASIRRPGSREPVRRDPIELALAFGGDGILAVFFSADATPLTSAIERAGTLRRSRPPMQASACADDEDCAITHGCSHFCRAGACLPPSEARCSEHDELDPGVRCVERAIVQLPLAPADAAVSGPRAASTLGNRCVEHLRRGDLDLAEAACARALSLGGTASTRGAVYYNLGRVAEARGERDRAASYYERSLEERPGHAAVEAALDALREDEDEE